MIRAVTLIVMMQQLRPDLQIQIAEIDRNRTGSTVIDLDRRGESQVDEGEGGESDGDEVEGDANGGDKSAVDDSESDESEGGESETSTESSVDEDTVDLDGAKPLDVMVSFDGTWHKRGFTSLYGVGIVIDVMTGLVLDYEVLSKFCQACSMKDVENMSERERNEWNENHKCTINFSGSSKAMEKEAAIRMWRRSIEKHNMRYTRMLSDGDSAAFSAVKNIYNGVEVKKLECVNHVDKRMGTALLKLAREKKLGG